MMRVRDLIRRFRGDQNRAQGVIDGQAVKIRDLESKLEATEAALVKSMRSGRGGTDEQVGFLKQELERRARLIDQLRAGVVDDAQTAELRRQIHDLKAAHKGLHEEVAILTAANSGIPRLAEAAA
ncbi:hypothetical protein [Streptomyces xanthophaeus]|uniref:hypothetical protein n=1 Tax=Streptomyces xanthophaeus TaxID=67385 RepID=UPI00264A0449|nr:hypothetical protein [Streptomyces xanthophaeus]WKD36554.1 hypothetical protein KO717_34550 [Streptomyces xanthophaeus]